ncbi:hypothetical protein Zmor_009634 [Zophobas morio]|uniref:Tyr recombinase domain-containing protein n=1 Tax=Zophobas morio TaxID=2755281 RepID=A0AA38IMG4_9CUCU|nr:hypothetical protein Zmor_009634 [Zophobas morio]
MSSDGSCTPPEVRETANIAVSNLLPTKSRARYENSYHEFVKWCDRKHIKNYTENCLLAYFEEISIHKKSLWCIYSMLKSCINLKHNIDISKYPKLIAMLKRKTEHHNPKKSQVLNEEHILKFLSAAPNRDYLLMKALLVIGISGACRRGELCKMLVDDVVFKDDIVMVCIPETKTYVKREFFISKGDWIKVIDQFLKIRLLVKGNNKRLFLTYRDGKCINSPVGINTIGRVPSLIAGYLKLQNPQNYSGHCFRRSSATLLANKGSDFLSIKRHGGWKSSSVAEGYIQDSEKNKMKIADIFCAEPGLSKPNTYIFSAEPGPSKPNSYHVSTALNNENTLKASGVSISSCNQCTINVNIYNSNKNKDTE